MSKRNLIETILEKGGGVFRLNPVFVPRRFGTAGRRLKLHPDDYYALGIERGSIKERWFSSTIVAQNGPLAAPDEGLSYVACDHNSNEKFSLKEAIEELGEKIVGTELMEKHGGWPIYSKYFDYQNPLFHHIHLTFEAAARVGKLGKPESYFFPKQLNNHMGDFCATYFGFDPDITKEEIIKRLKNFTKEDTRITELSRAFRVQLGTGWYTPTGVIHAPASVLTYEPQWNSDVNSVWENIVGGEIYPHEMVYEECPKDKQQDIDYIFSLLDWEKNIDPNYRKTNFRPPVTLIDNNTYKEDWIIYANPYFSAKEMTIYPGETVTVKDEAAYGIIFVQGHGQFGKYKCETPTLLRYGKQSDDEFFVTEATAKEGIKITNSSLTEPLVGLKHFGPNNKNAPQKVI